MKLVILLTMKYVQLLYIVLNSVASPVYVPMYA